ncbi:MAG: hypothetical protein C0478_10970 [Planctomyces sp.]|nr:hypothetical protein [Planctomyces sp.]
MLSHSLFGYGVAEFGDAYDISCSAAEIGGEGFDFSLKLMRAAEVERILYAECKFRDEQSGRTDSEFKAYLCSVYRALTNASNDVAAKAEFLFVATVPPDSWREFLRNKAKFIRTTITAAKLQIDDIILNRVCSQADVIVLGERVIVEAG